MKTKLKNKIDYMKTRVGSNINNPIPDGKHLRIDIHNVPKELTFNKEIFKQFLDELPKKVDMITLNDPFIVKGASTNPGLTGFIIIDTSHISFHSFANKNRINFDIYSCKEFNTDTVIQYAQKVFNISKENMIIKEDLRF